MRVLRPVVCSQAPIVLSRKPDRAERCRIGSQPVGHNPARRKAVLLKQFHHEFLCGLCIPSALDEEIQHLTLVVDRPPEPVFTAADRNHHFIEVPMIARSRPRTADIRRDRRPELQEPPPDRLVGCVNTSLGQQFLDIPKGQCEPGIEPDRVADDFWREAVALKRYRSHPMMLIGDEPQSYPSYRDIAGPLNTSPASRAPGRFPTLVLIIRRDPWPRGLPCPLLALADAPSCHFRRGGLNVKPWPQPAKAADPLAHSRG